MLLFSCMTLLTVFFQLFSGKKKANRRTIKDYQREIFQKQGKEQFEKIMKLGRVPVTFL